MTDPKTAALQPETSASGMADTIKKGKSKARTGVNSTITGRASKDTASAPVTGGKTTMDGAFKEPKRSRRPTSARNGKATEDPDKMQSYDIGSLEWTDKLTQRPAGGAHGGARVLRSQGWDGETPRNDRLYRLWRQKDVRQVVQKTQVHWREQIGSQILPSHSGNTWGQEHCANLTSFTRRRSVHGCDNRGQLATDQTQYRNTRRKGAQSQCLDPEATRVTPCLPIGPLDRAINVRPGR